MRIVNADLRVFFRSGGVFLRLRTLLLCGHTKVYVLQEDDNAALFSHRVTRLTRLDAARHCINCGPSGWGGAP